MGRSRKVTYGVHYVVDRAMWTPGEWRATSKVNAPGYGRPTDENLKKHCMFVEASSLPGGCNDHLGVTKILSAYIVDYRTGEPVAWYTRS